MSASVPASSASASFTSASSDSHRPPLGRKIDPTPIAPGLSVVELVNRYFTAYNGARLKELCQLLEQRVLQPGVTVGLSLSGAMTPAGFGVSVLAPLLRAGFIDYVISTGANLYHDLHYGLGMDLFSSSPFLDDVELRKNDTIRIYDITFGYDVLLDTDAFVRRVIQTEPFQHRMGTAEFHYRLGECIHAVEQQRGATDACLLATAWECGVPVFTSSPGDSSIGMNVAAIALEGSELVIDPSIDVNETAAIAYFAREQGVNGQPGQSAALMIGGGSPKNFLLQTQPQLHEVLGLEEHGHDYFMQVTDARPDTGGLSGAIPSEAVSWGKVDPEALADTVVCYTDSAIALPIIGAYVLDRCAPRPLKRLYDHREQNLAKLRECYLAARGDRPAAAPVPATQSDA